VSEAARRWGADRRARPAQCRAARFEYILNSNYFKTFQILTNPKIAFPSPIFLK
jgi:hypothetical protein